MTIMPKPVLVDNLFETFPNLFFVDFRGTSTKKVRISSLYKDQGVTKISKELLLKYFITVFKLIYTIINLIWSL